MVTRLVSGKREYTLKSSSVFSETINVSGYRSAKIVSRVSALTSGEQIITFTDERGENVPLYGKYIADNIYFSQYFTESGAMNAEWVIDLEGISELTISKTGNNYIEGSIYIYFSYDKADKEAIRPDACILRKTSSVSEYEFDVINNYVKVDCIFMTPASNAYTVRFYGMKHDSDEWTLLMPWSFSKGTRYSSGYYQGKDDFDLWLYAEEYKKVKISVTEAYQQTTPLFIYISQTATLTRTIHLDKKDVQIPDGIYLRGKIRYAIVEFKGASCTEKALRLGISSINSAPSVYNRCGEKLMMNQQTEISGYSRIVAFTSAAESITGKLFLVWDDVDALSNASIVSSNNRILKAIPETPLYNGEVYITLSDEEKIPFDEKPIPNLKTDKYCIYHHDTAGGEVIDALGEDILVKISETSYRLYRNGFAGWYYDISIDNTHIPSLIDGETIKFAKLVYTNNSVIGKTPTRVCLFTNKDRILYNFVNGFYDYFREAPVYNLNKKFYPVNDKTKISTVAKYLPIYPDYNYNQFEGRVGDGTEKDIFGIALPQRGDSVGNLLEDYHVTGSGLGKLVYSNFVNSKAYGCIYGNYNLINGDPILLASSGGDEWLVIKNFASVEDYALNQLTTLKVDLSPIISSAGGYVSGSLKITRRKFNIPTSKNKEPEHPFTIGASAIIDSISVINNETIITFVDETPLISDDIELTRLTDLAPIVFFENIGANSEYNYICNSCDQDGNGNTGIIFRLQRIGTNKYKLWGNVGDPFESALICRHIHSVSEYQSGFVVATGENYRTTYGEKNATLFEGGFIYIVHTSRNNALYPYNYNKNNALSSFFGTFYRLTSSEFGVNRACGAYLMSDLDNTLLYTSDDLYSPSVVVPINGRTDGFKRTKHGVYRIPIKDIDDLSKADCVAEIKEAGFGLVEHRGRFFICTSNGEAIFSTDFGKTWNYQTISLLYPSAPNLPYIDIKGVLNDGSVFYLNDQIKFSE